MEENINCGKTNLQALYNIGVETITAYIAFDNLLFTAAMGPRCSFSSCESNMSLICHVAICSHVHSALRTASRLLKGEQTF